MQGRFTIFFTVNLTDFVMWSLTYYKKARPMRQINTRVSLVMKSPWHIKKESLLAKFSNTCNHTHKYYNHQRLQKKYIFPALSRS